MTSQQPQQHRAPSKFRTGQATVELALVISFLALLLVGIADVARIYSEHLAVVHAAGVGARWLTLDPNYKACSGYTAVGTPVIEDLSSSIQAANILTITDSAQGNPVAVRVDITYRHDYLFGLVKGVPSVFTGGATMPGTITTTLGACPTPPQPPPTATPTNTPLPTITPTPACPYNLTVQSYKHNGNFNVVLRITLRNAANQPVAGANIVATIGNPVAETLNGVTDINGFVCFNSANQYPGNSVSGNVSAPDPPCPVSKAFTANNNNAIICP